LINQAAKLIKTIASKNVKGMPKVLKRIKYEGSRATIKKSAKSVRRLAITVKNIKAKIKTDITKAF
jgi:hypothetical protein